MTDDFENFPLIGGLMVSKMVTEENVKPGFIYREKPVRPEDSGWRIFTGFEPEDYVNNPENTGIYHPATILNIDPTIATLLLTGIGSVYERNEDNGEWYKVTDYELEDDYIATHLLTAEWQIDINNLFVRTVEESGDLLYTTGDKSVRLAIWNQEKTKEALAAEHQTMILNRDQTVTPTLEAYDSSDNEVIRLGYLVKENDGFKTYNVFYGFCLIDGQVVQAAFSFNDIEDKDWAIATWQGIKLQ